MSFFIICFIIFNQILTKRLVSFRKLKISSGFMFLKKSFKLLVSRDIPLGGGR